MREPFDRQWLGQDRQAAWRLLLLVMSQLPSSLNRQLQADSGMSFQDFDVLVHLQESVEGRLRLGELAEGLGWERSRTSHHVARMEGRGMVRREPVDGDGRGAWVTATPEGLHQLALAAPAHIALVQRLLFDGLDEDDVTHLIRILTRALGTMGVQPRTMWHVEATTPTKDAR